MIPRLVAAMRLVEDTAACPGLTGGVRLSVVAVKTDHPSVRGSVGDATLSQQWNQLFREAQQLVQPSG
jgi:hypothetical protein